MSKARQREIVEQAIGLIARRGIQELTMRNLASQLGISDPAIYRHFESKQAILLAVLDVLEREVLGGIASDTTDGSPRDLLAQNFRTLFARLASAPDLSAVIFADEVFQNEEVLASRVRMVMERTLAGVEHLLERAAKANEVRSDVSPSSLAIMLAGSVRLVVRRWHLEEYGFDIEVAGERVVNDFLKLVRTAE